MTDIEKGMPRPENDAYRVLVVVQRPEHLEHITLSCKALGQEVVPAATLVQAMKFLDTKDHVDVVVAEAFLQDESSFEFLMHLKKMPAHQQVPVMLVAWEPGEVARFCAESLKETANYLGAYKFLIMPDFDVEQMMKEVQSILPVRTVPKKEQGPDGES